MSTIALLLVVFVRSDDYVSYMQAVAAAAPHLPFYLYDIDFITGIHSESCVYMQTV